MNTLSRTAKNKRIDELTEKALRLQREKRAAPIGDSPLRPMSDRLRTIAMRKGTQPGVGTSATQAAPESCKVHEFQKDSGNKLEEPALKPMTALEELEAVSAPVTLSALIFFMRGSLVTTSPFSGCKGEGDHAG